MKADRSLIPEGKLGRSANVNPERSRSVRSFTRVSSVPEKYGALLYRISRWFRPDQIIELGTGLGLSALYLGQGHRKAFLQSIEGNTDRVNFAAQMLSGSGLEEVNIHWGEMDDKLELILPSLQGKILAFVDGNHRREPTLHYVKSIVDRMEGEGVLIMHDIYWSKGMHEAWKEVSQWPEVDASIDLYFMGILLCRPGLTKSRIKLKF
jgi:predicted O-methyltransferase YrrM